MREPSKQLAKHILASIADSDEVYSKQIKPLLPKKQIFKFTFIGLLSVMLWTFSMLIGQASIEVVPLFALLVLLGGAMGFVLIYRQIKKRDSNVTALEKQESSNQNN